MGLVQYWLGWFIIHLVSCLLLFCNIASAQFDISEGITGSTSFPDVAITCLGNLALFFTCLVRGRLHAEMGVKDLLDSITDPRLKGIGGAGLITCRYEPEDNDQDIKLDLLAAEVVMLSKHEPDHSMRQFMKYSSHLHGVPSIQLQFLPLNSCGEGVAEICSCYQHKHAIQMRKIFISTHATAFNTDEKDIYQHTCNCIVFNTDEKDIITIMVAERMPGTLKQLRDFRCLLPCEPCLINGCHGCNKGLLHVEDVEEEVGTSGDVEAGRGDVVEEEAGRGGVVEEEAGGGDVEAGKGRVVEEEAGRKNKKKKLIEGDPKKWPVAAVCEILDKFSSEIFEERNCLCIPTRPSEKDKWTKMLITSLKTKDGDEKGGINVASDALQNYIAQCGVCNDEEEYSTLSLIVPRLAEALVNMILTGWLRVDGFSSALIARRAIRNYIVDSTGRGIAGNAFLTKSRVYSNVENTDVCQLLTFRHGLPSFGIFSIIITCVNLLCSVTWAVLIALEGGDGKWYEPQAMPISKPILYVIIGGFGIETALFYLDVGILIFKHRSRPTSLQDPKNDLKMLIDNQVKKLMALRKDVKIWIIASRKNETVCMFVVIIVGSLVSSVIKLWCIVLAAKRNLKGIGRWYYGALQALVWLRWGLMGSDFNYSLEYNTEMGRPRKFRLDRLSYACTFLLHAIFVGVRGKWKYLSS